VLRKFWNSSWRNSLLFIPGWFLLWLLSGIWLKGNYFDSDTFNAFKLLNNVSDTLEYVALLFAVQIPVFILLLQRMVESGLIKRHILPSIINFREVLFSYIALSFLLLFSPRASYLYLPVIALTLLSLYAIWVAIRVLFEQRKLKAKEDSFLKGLVKKVFDQRLKIRILNNNFFEQLKTQELVTHSFLDPFDDENTDIYEIRSRKGGRVKSIDVESLISIMEREYPPSEINERDTETKEEKSTSQVKTPKPKLVLVVRPGSSVQKDDVLLKLLQPQVKPKPDKGFLRDLEKNIDIVPDDDNSADERLNDLITDFKQQLRDTIDKDNVVLIEQSLEFYRLLLQGLSEFSKALTDPGYKVENARQEFRNAWGMDSVSEQLTAISDIITDEFEHALREGKKDTSMELIRFIYSDLLEVSRKQDVMAIGRADHTLVTAIYTVLYAENRDIPSSPMLTKISNDILFRFKEQSGLLLYRLREEDFDKEIITGWLKIRLNDLRAFLLGSYVKDNVAMFKEFLTITSEYFVERRYYEQPDVGDVLTKLTRCNLLMVAAFMEGRKESDNQKECHKLLYEHIASWQADELTLALIESIDNDYSHKWNVETYDMPMDGKVYSVPDYGDKLREVWLQIFLQYYRSFPSEVTYYESLPLATTFTFTSGLSNDNDAFLMKRLTELEQESNDKAGTSQLKELVEKFIAVRRDWEETKLVETPLSRKKISDFRNSIINGYKERSVTYRIFKRARKLELVKKPDDQFKRLGWNQIMDKEAFIEDWHIGYHLPADQYGGEIARFQDQIISDAMFAGSNELDFPSFVSTLKKDKAKWVLIGRNVGNWYIQMKFEKYLSKGNNLGDIRLKGVNQLFPVQILYDQSKAKGLYAIRLSDIGKLKIKPYYNQPIEVSVGSYTQSDKMLQEILSEPPEWLKKKGDKSAQEKYLKTKARMLINYIYKYEPKIDPTTFYVSLDEDRP
jgi:hypothetical protein